MALRDAVQGWADDLSNEEITHLVDDHLREHRRSYLSGSGDGLFWMVEAAIRRKWQAKHPVREEASERPGRKRRGRLGPVPHLGGVDVFDDRDDGGSLEDDRASNVERPSGLPGYEGSGRPIAEDEGVD